MKQKGFLLGVWLVFFVAVSASVPASEYKLVNGQKDFYYGHISYAEIKNDGQDPVVFREGRSTPEIAILNLPLGPGDVIQTSGERRSEVQFDNGTILRLDLDSRLGIETILAPSLSTAQKISNLVLERGRIYVMSKKYKSLEIFQVITPGAAVKLDHNSVALIRLTEDGKTDVQVERGKAFLLYGEDKARLSQKRINAGQRGVVSADNRFELAEYEVLSDFKAWNESVNSHFQELHEENYLPKPLQKLPPAVFEFAQKFGNMYGEWLWHDLYGYVWRPYLNDRRYPWGTWAPYINGSWSNCGGEMFWVPGEPWGWVPYHLGIWMWDKSKGWVWLPGSLFAPAWAVWEFYSGMYYWRPFYLYDWMSGFDSFWGPVSWAGYYNPGRPPGQNAPIPQPPQDVIDNIRKDQLKKSDSPSLPMPKEMKKAFEATLAALKSGDQTLLSSVRGLPRSSPSVQKEDFLSLRGPQKVISSARNFRGNAAAGAREATAPPVFRFRDWNPDVRAAIRLGMEISYSSRTNEVTCPRLGLSSRQIKPAMRAMMRTSAGSAPSSSPSSSSGHPSAASSPSHSSGHSSSARSSGSQKQKN
jgi:hypothetical protein